VIKNAEEDRANELRVLAQAFKTTTTNRRALRISFVYNPNYDSSGAPEPSHHDVPSSSSLSHVVGVQDHGHQIHAQFDLRTQAFQQVLRQHSHVAAQCMKTFVDLQLPSVEPRHDTLSVQ
jgi:hypothetical protein